MILRFSGRLADFGVVLGTLPFLPYLASFGLIGGIRTVCGDGDLL